MILSAHGLVKKHGPNTVIDKVSLDIEAGEVVGLLGHNGAGKSSLIRIILGLDRPTSGQIRVKGSSLDTAVRSGFVMRFVAEGVGGPRERSVRRHLEALCKLEGLPISSVENALAKVNLTDAANKRLADCSAGMRQRVGIASAWLAPCGFLAMDEPTNSLDPKGPDLVEALVSDVVASNGSVVLASHDVKLISRICSRVIYLHQGQVVRVEARPDTDGQLSAIERAQWEESLRGSYEAILEGGHSSE